MRPILLIIAIIVGLLLLAVLAAGLLVLAAYGIAWVLTRFLPFSTFEASLLSLIALLGMALTAARLVTAIGSFPVSSTVTDDEEDEWDDEDEEDDEDLEEEGASPAPARPAITNFVPGIPRWRQSPRPDFSKARRNDPCPCGSGKKFKNCHGATANRT